MMIYTQRRSKASGLRLAEWGFTLMELVIVVAVIGILAAIAIPTYQDSVRKSRRADAKGILLQAAQWMERRYTTNNCYDDPCGSGTAPALDTTLTVSPTGCSLAVPDCYYTITLTAVAQNSYTLSAAPIATTNQITDRCQTLTLDNTGAKGVTNGATLSVSECWR